MGADNHIPEICRVAMEARPTAAVHAAWVVLLALIFGLTMVCGWEEAWALTYYVNDGAVTNDNWCTAPGTNQTGRGTSSNAPATSVEWVLGQYDLEPGDIVRIDTGVYVLTNDITVTPEDEGSADDDVVFEASPYGVTIDRNDTALFSDPWHLDDCDYVTVRTGTSTQHPGVPQRWMRLTGGSYGCRVDYAEHCTLARIDVCSNSGRGINMWYAHYTVLSNNLVRDNGREGIAIYHTQNGELWNNTVARNDEAQIFIGNGSSPIMLRNNVVQGGTWFDHCIYWYSTNYVLDSDHNLLSSSGFAAIGYAGRDIRVMTDWQATSGGDTNSLYRDPGFVDPDSGDYHLRSTAGSYHAGAWSNDTSNSFAIDTGYGGVGSEPAPNSTPRRIPELGARNLGAYGGTEQASKTPNGRLLTMRNPIGWERFVDQRVPVDVFWTFLGSAWTTNDTLALGYSDDCGGTWQAATGGASVAVGDGAYSWAISNLNPGAMYRVKLTCNQDGAVVIDCPRFALGDGTATFYVNDNSTNNDEWCTAPGVDGAGRGGGPGTPAASITWLLDTYYYLDPGDVVRIDTGTYTLTNNIELGYSDRGEPGKMVTFEASPYGVTLDRNNAAIGNYVWDLDNSDYVAIRTVTSTQHPGVPQTWVKVTGAYGGILLQDAEHCVLERLDVCANANDGLYVVDSDCGEYANSCIRSNGRHGIRLWLNSNIVVRNCTIVSNYQNQVHIDSGNARVTLRNNIIYSDLTPGYSTFGIFRNASVTGLDSDYNLMFASNGACIGSAAGMRVTLADWQAASGQDANSVSGVPLFVDAAADDYHLQSTAGSYHGGAWTSDPADSPGIDTGDPGDSCTNEPHWNGGFVNMGAYGNTEQASRSFDTDGDGLSDALEVNKLGSSPGDTDSDDDDASDWQEYIADTDATNASSRLMITSVLKTNGGIRVEWQGGEWARQYVECRTNLLSTVEQWRAIFTNDPDTPITNWIIDLGATNDTLYYRIKAERP